MSAAVKTEEKTLLKFSGMLGRVVGLFGGKAAKDGVVFTVAVNGQRKARLNDTNGQIIDLAEEKVYDLDIERKTYAVPRSMNCADASRKHRRRLRNRPRRSTPKRRRRPTKPGRKSMSTSTSRIPVSGNR